MSATANYAALIRSLREFTIRKVDTEPLWRKKSHRLNTGYPPDR